ncbi:MAG: hypothetical protein AB7O24_20515 [Kofleriaceae bacterium]
MSDLDPRLQQAAAEYLEHQNHRFRMGRKYGVVMFLAFLLIAGGMVALFMWRSSIAETEMNEQYERDVQEMRERHDERVQELNERTQRLVNDPASSSAH